ncbi:uncharacterized protein MYCFIDRAFT_213218 [Pseudocercospora fijiensis CIRAD86]|uniref:RIC1 C-terminal alpha solenoid region domain-containing protein n=1 Tax=Pseudocercospora fijiensis (strain CIRAD86) TaxID=383855 RepID=N1Q8Z6_PSEFD|nr:uncharacterized protein MYCFIDRAFT_213218 [Pseudocercospora fijiensis CIRAD86]EME88251.1 hypothetical protein MYCFIDRAFT_213218 [Pseudocercospora fijiensis CIRAD86]
MYWPVGAPNVFSLTKHAIAAAKTTSSNDGLEAPLSESSTDLGDDTKGETKTERNKSRRQDGGIEGKGMHTPANDEIIDAKISRSGNIFITLTATSLVVWQTRPTVALAIVQRSQQSLKAYGQSTALLLRSDALLIVVQTALGYLITYSMSTDPNTKVYQTPLPETNRHVRRPSTDGYSNLRKQSTITAANTPAEGDGIREINVRFRMVIRIDAGIGKAVALDDELVVATKKPAALQCIRWIAESGSSQTSTELVSRMEWIGKKVAVTDIVHDRPMNLFTWITNDGAAYAVQRCITTGADAEGPKGLFQGFCFRDAEGINEAAVKVAINARFSLIAVGTAIGLIDVYTVKDYTGNIPLSHKIRLPVGPSTTGKLTALIYSPDGYCLFAGYEKGWALWTVYGKPCANTFSADSVQSENNDERWLRGIKSAFWVGGGSELALLPVSDDRLWFLDMARNALAGCFSPSNISRGLLHSTNSVMLYKGHDVPDVTSLPSDISLWQTIQVPHHYLAHQWPIKSAVVSPDGHYIAVAGKRGLAHYSVASGRWRTFDDPQAEQEFAVRGGMCWHHHILIASVEANGRYEVRLYSREKALDFAHVQHTEKLSHAAISTIVSGADSLLVYTYGNILLHYIIVMGGSSPKLVQVGQIGFHGIIRAPPRVRTISWILPEDQLEHGDPSQDVATASVLFLVDGKLVLLQPATNEYGDLKYDMRVIVQNIEFYMLLRDQPITVASLEGGNEGTDTPPANGLSLDDPTGHSLRDSLWYFDGSGFHVWSDIQDVLARAPAELGRELPSAVAVPLDFSPVSAVVGKGIVSGIEADLVQRRDVNFSFFRHAPRTQLFLPQLLRYHLTEFNSPAALHLSKSYQHLPYFAHALEVLLHDVLDAEVDTPPVPPETALLPTVLSFLSSFSFYLDVVCNCTRKTELRSWQTLFSYLPPVIELFQQSLLNGKLNTAAGYLLVLHAFEEGSFQVHEFALLLQRASEENDWELCRELSRFLVGIDASGKTLASALAAAGLRDAPNGKKEDASRIEDVQRQSGSPNHRGAQDWQRRRSQTQVNGQWRGDYFSLEQRLINEPDVKTDTNLMGSDA